MTAVDAPQPPRTCRTPDCTRRPVPLYAHCPDCTDRLVRAAFGPKPGWIERLAKNAKDFSEGTR